MILKQLSKSKTLRIKYKRLTDSWFDFSLKCPFSRVRVISEDFLRIHISVIQYKSGPQLETTGDKRVLSHNTSMHAPGCVLSGPAADSCGHESQNWSYSHRLCTMELTMETGIIALHALHEFVVGCSLLACVRLRVCYHNTTTLKFEKAESNSLISAW